MSVEPGKVIVVDEDKKAKEAAAEEKRLAIMMIPKKKKRLYKQIMYGKRKKLNEVSFHTHTLSCIIVLIQCL